MANTFTKELKWVLTEYGKRRITEMLNNPEDRIRITTLQIGDDNSGEPGDRESLDHIGDGRLFHQVGGNIPVYEKGIAEERENTVYFRAIIGEDMSGFNIGEAALFETRNGELKMFAVGVSELLAKPNLDLGYIISIEYTIFIESANLLDVYDRIELDPANEFLKESDIEDVYKTLLYIEGNMAEQIGNNTHILGLNRAQQVNDLIEKSQLGYSSSCISTYYANLSNTLNNLENILGFWSFGYSDIYGTKSNIKDFSANACNFSTNKNLSSYKQEFLGMLSSLNFNTDDYFYLDKMVPAICPTNNLEIGALFEYEKSGNLIYSDTYNAWVFGGQTYTEEEVKQNIVMYYLRPTSASTTSSTIELGEIVPNKKAYAPHTFTYNATTLKWSNEIGISYDTVFFKNNVIDYTGAPSDGDTITLTTTLTPNNDEIIILTGERFDLLQYTKEKSTLRYNDSPFTFMAVLQHNTYGERNVLLAQSNYFNNIHNFEFVKTENNAIEITLFTDSNNFYRCKTSDYVVPNGLYNLIITYDGNSSRPHINIYINGEKPTVYDNRDTGEYTYTGMKPNLMETTSYVRELGTDNKINTINAKICLMSLIREELTTQDIKCNSLLLNSLCGKNIYYKV